MTITLGDVELQMGLEPESFDEAEAPRCERCGAALDESARRLVFLDRRAGVLPARRGRRLERTVCRCCADTLAEAVAESLPRTAVVGRADVGSS